MRAVLIAGIVFSLSAVALAAQGPKPREYSERDLCEVWAAAQCHAASCQDNAKDRCSAESRKCRNSSRANVGKDRANRVSGCAKALLKAKCGAPNPSECADVTF